MSRRVITLINLFYALLLIFLALAPRLPSLPGFHPSDLLAHGVAYGVQGVLLYYLFLRYGRSVSLFVWSVIGASSFGVLTEVLQLMSRRRHFEFKDMVADTLGAILFVAAFQVFRGFCRDMETG